MYNFFYISCPFCDMGSYICNPHSPLPNPLSQEMKKKKPEKSCAIPYHSYGVYISQLVCFSHFCNNVSDFNNRNLLFTDKLVYMSSFGNFENNATNIKDRSIFLYCGRGGAYILKIYKDTSEKKDIEALYFYALFCF